jgi:hypothetical protein
MKLDRTKLSKTETVLLAAIRDGLFVYKVSDVWRHRTGIVTRTANSLIEKDVVRIEHGQYVHLKSKEPSNG